MIKKDWLAAHDILLFRYNFDIDDLITAKRYMSHLLESILISR